MKDAFLKIIMFLATIVVVITCAEDENLGKEGPISSCFDGIMNGAEQGVDCGGTCVIVCPPSNKLQGEIVVPLELNPSIEYLVTGPLLIRDGAKLLIPAGTVIKVQSGVNAYIAIAQGGQIFANGVDRTEIIDVFYGGTVNDDTSGIMRYLRVEYAGAQYDDTKQFNALSFYGVGAFTTLTYVQAVNCLGDGFKFIGGTVNPKWMVSTATRGNGLYFTDGWNGEGDSWYITDANKAGIRIGNNLINEQISPITTGNLHNISIVGPFTNGAIHYTNGGAITTFNNVYTSEVALGINVSGATAAAQIEMNNLTVNTIQFVNPTVGFNATNHSGANNTFYTIGANLGAGNEAELPTWAEGWTVGFN